MATRWSGEFNISEHKDLQASTMALDKEGSNILLAGKRFIAIKNIDHFSDSLKKFPRQTKYEVKAAEWNPTSLYNQYCALCTNDKVEIYSYHSGQLDFLYFLRNHTRLVTDLNWHKFEPNLLATSSIDTFTHVWDLRDPRKPAESFAAVASSNHVRWNKLSLYLIATAHEGDIRIWDQRKPTVPIQYICANFSRIHGLDWSQTHEYELATYGQDGTVKFFDVTNPRCTESVIQTGGPVWRAGYTPFGEGLLTVVIPQNRRIENSLSLWNLSNQSMPVYTFVGYADIILEFSWKRQGRDGSEYELITWSKDQILRSWKIEPFMQKLCGYEADGVVPEMVEDIESDVIDSNTSAGLVVEDSVIPAIEAMNINMFNVPDYCQSPEKTAALDSFKYLKKEFSSLVENINLPNLTFEEIDASKRSCSINVRVKTHFVSLHATFPLSYPYNTAPSFQIKETSNINTVLKTKLLKVLKQTAQQRVKKNKMCLESCIIQFLTTLENSIQLLEVESKQSSRLPPTSNMEVALSHDSYLYGAIHDVHIPYPKTCGARFCGVDLLVCFHRSSWPRKLTSKPETSTPRSLSSKSEMLTYPGIYVIRSGVHDNPNQTLRYFMHSKGLSKSGPPHSENIQGSPKPTFAKTVTIYDCSKLFLVHRELGENYVFDDNTVDMCQKNAEVAKKFGRQDLVQTWTLAGLIFKLMIKDRNSKDSTLWTDHPLSKSLIEHIILYYAKMSDVQTAAMLCCAFTVKNEQKRSYSNKILEKYVNASPRTSPYRSNHGTSPSVENPRSNNSSSNDTNNNHQPTSDSLPGSLDELRYLCYFFNSEDDDELDSFEKGFDCSKPYEERPPVMYDVLKKKYAEILHRWNLLENRVEVSKLFCAPPDCYRYIQFSGDCNNCKKRVTDSVYCPTCKKILLKCALCRIAVRGSSIFCLVCGHGGHMKHVLDWFNTEISCPAGCSCKCLLEMSTMLDI